ncbi:MAG: dephospho-CoA kinase [Candidatus Omnitrophica bacterium]|nr:dephospho-CoA kinase [Candidatus Omnitrophota bacterium]
MCIIGLTGGLGTGKSTVAKMFRGLGAAVLSADDVAHQLLRPGTVCFRQIIKDFGKGVLKGRKIDRKAVAQLVFRDKQQLRRLEKIIHPAVRKIILARIKRIKRQNRNRVVVVDVPLLFEAEMDRNVNVSIVVKASHAKRIERAVKSLNITRAEAKRRIDAQMPLRQKIRLADIIIDNDGTLNQTKKQVKQIWERL